MHSVSVHVAATLAKFLDWKRASNTNLKLFIDLPVMVLCDPVTKLQSHATYVCPS